MITSTRKQQILTLLKEPISYVEMADTLDLSASACRNYINELQNSGRSIGYNTDDNGAKLWYLRGEQKEHPINPEQPTGELRSKSAVTKDAKETALHSPHPTAEDRRCVCQLSAGSRRLHVFPCATSQDCDGQLNPINKMGL